MMHTSVAELPAVSTGKNDGATRLTGDRYVPTYTGHTQMYVQHVDAVYSISFPKQNQSHY